MLEVVHQVVAVDHLLRLAGTDADGLRQVEMVAAAALEQEMIHDPKDFGVDRQRLACAGFRN